MSTIVDGVESKWIYAGMKYIAIASGADVADWDEVMANARLIAQAPALYAALKGMVDIAYRLPGCPDSKCRTCAENKAAVDNAKAVLAAVEGK